MWPPKPELLALDSLLISGVEAKTSLSVFPQEIHSHPGFNNFSELLWLWFGENLHCRHAPLLFSWIHASCFNFSFLPDRLPVWSIWPISLPISQSSVSPKTFSWSLTSILRAFNEETFPTVHRIAFPIFLSIFLNDLKQKALSHWWCISCFTLLFGFRIY